MEGASITTVQKLAFSPRGEGEVARDLVSVLEATAVQPAELRRLQLQTHLGGVLRVASNLIPGYKERLPKWCQGGQLVWEDFHKLPVLTRLDLQTQGALLEHPNPPPPYRAQGSTTTSGSTGTPIVTKGHRVAGLMKRAQQIRFQKRYAFDFDADCAFITSPQKPGVADPPDGRVAGNWSGGFGSGRALLLDLMADTEQQLHWLIRQDPTYIATYPSNLQALVQLSVERGVRPNKLQSIVLSSEPVSPELTTLVKRAWGATCIATYSSSEAGLMAVTREGHGDYYVEAEAIHLEVLRDDNSPCQPGEVGRIVITTLQEFLRPLIRYEVGDYAEVVEQDPGDPITLPRLGPIVGRERTMVKLPDGRRVWPHFEFAPLLEVGGLEKWQLVQHADLTMTVRVVAKDGLSDLLRDRVVEIVRGALPGIDAKVCEVADIPRTPRGKFMELISEL